jgi:hypothetical protein
MDLKKLYKQVCAFERRTLQLDTHNDTMSDIDWNTLSDKLAADDLEEEDSGPRFTLNERHKEHLVDEKSNWIMDINPLLFLRMTTDNIMVMNEILDNAKSLDFYNSPEINQKMNVHPSLSVNKNTGKIEGHEGRHRAAAVHHAGGKWYRIGVKLMDTESRNHGVTAMPWIWTAQFNSEQFDIKALIAQNKIKVLSTTVQKDFWR